MMSPHYLSSLGVAIHYKPKRDLALTLWAGSLRENLGFCLKNIFQK